MKIAKSPSFRMMPLLALYSIATMTIGCGSGKTTSNSSVPPPSAPTAPVIVPPPPSAFIPLSKTLFVGDVIVGEWPLVQTAYSSAGVLQNCRIGGDNCTIAGIDAAFTTDECVTGCSPSFLQSVVANGVKRVVFVMGTFDVLASSACLGGKTPLSGWSGEPYSYGDPMGAYQGQVQSALGLYKVSVFVGTIPPIDGLPVVKEAVTREEIDGYHQLEAYHYRGTVLHGRRVPLVVCSSDPLLPTVLGYVELSTAFMMNKPRAAIFNAEFRDGSGIAWTQWNKDAVRKFTNVVVRIARCVVSPEFRGLGVARILVEHAAQFARAHWNVGRLRPLFLEITADMLRYVPFVEGAGMLYVGDTEGNLARVNKDMNYILKNYSRMKSREILKEESAGIVDLQVFYASRIHEIESAQGIDREKLLKLLIQAPHRLSDEHWSLLHRVYRSPKPTFLLGLSDDSQAFLERRVKELGLAGRYPAKHPRPLDPDPSSKAIVVSNCGYKVESPLLRTKATRKVQEAFGIHKEMLSTTLFSNLSFKITPGEIVLLCGPSGAGKTTLLSVLRKALMGSETTIPGMQGEVRVSKHVEVASLEPLPNNLPLISALGSHCSIDEALYALSLSGLAEAQLYVKRFRDLSNGQRYRAMMAKLIASRASVWLADEFCATLDPVTANIVARNLRRSAETRRTSVIVAAANWSEFIEELRPDLVIHLRSPWEFRVFRWKGFRSAISRSKLTL